MAIILKPWTKEDERIFKEKVAKLTKEQKKELARIGNPQKENTKNTTKR